MRVRRNVSINLAGVSSDGKERAQEGIPDAAMFESLRVWTATPAGRLVMADGQKTHVSALGNRRRADPSDPRSETAIWGRREEHPRRGPAEIVTWRLEAAHPAA